MSDFKGLAELVKENWKLLTAVIVLNVVVWAGFAYMVASIVKAVWT